MPTTPYRGARSTRPGTKKMTSRARDSRVDCRGLPMDCRKMLLAFWMQHSRMPARYTRKHSTAYWLYRSLSLPKREMMAMGHSSNRAVAMRPTTTLASRMPFRVSSTRS